jgi:hypothetical protein
MLVLANNRGIGAGIKILPELGVLQVQAVKSDSLVSTWNRVHPDRQIDPGDHIVKVNGKSDLQQMVDQCTQSKTLSLRIQKMGGLFPCA